MRLKVFPSALVAAFLSETAVIQRVTAGSDPDARTTIVSSLKCDDPQWLDQEQKERAGMASVARALRVRCEVNTSIHVRDRFVYNSTDYRIVAVTPIPAVNPSHYELIIEDET